MQHLDNFLKKKFLLTEKNNYYKKLYFIFNKIFRKLNNVKKSYSFGGIDLLINYLYKDKFNGVYIDVGCNHPIVEITHFFLSERMVWY